MRSGLFLIFFVILSFCVISLLSIVAKKNHQAKIQENQSISSIDGKLLKIMKTKYFQFIESIGKQDDNLFKSICSPSFYKNNKIDNIKVNKLLFIVNSNVLNFKNNLIEIEFISRSINTEILYNKCEFLFTKNDFLLNNILA